MFRFVVFPCFDLGLTVPMHHEQFTIHPLPYNWEFVFHCIYAVKGITGAVELVVQLL